MQMREREAQINQEVKMREHYKHEQEWQKGREKRVGDWRNFTGDPVKKRRVRLCAALRCFAQLCAGVVWPPPHVRVVPFRTAAGVGSWTQGHAAG